jgi:hypothetical protein
MIMQLIPPILRSNIEEHRRRAQTEADIETKVFEKAKCDIQKIRQRIFFLPKRQIFTHGILINKIKILHINIIRLFCKCYMM